MPRQVQTPDGTVHTFPDDATDAEIASALNGAPAAAAVPAEPQSALSRGVGAAFEQVNPVPALRQVLSQSPLKTLQEIGVAQGRLGQRAKSAWDQGDYGQAALHTINYLLPIIGPAIQQQQDRLASGQTAEGIGGSIGLGASLFAPEAIKGVGAGVASPRLARAADAAATERMVDVMAPKIGPNKVRLGNVAENVAPEIAREPGLGAWSRQGLLEKVTGKLEEAAAELDVVSAARNPRLVYHTRPIIRELERQRERFIASTVKQGKVAAGADVLPAPRRARVAQIDQAISELEQLGPVASYEAIRRIREAWDGPAKAVYSPSLTSDYLAKMGEKLGAADVTGVLRSALAKHSPETAAANARYHLFKSAQDVLEAAEEIERVRPKVGRKMVARWAGATVGAGHSWKAGLAGWVLGPVVENAVGKGWTVQIKTARLLADLSDAIRGGQVGRVQSLRHQLWQLTQQSSRLGAAQESLAPFPSPALAGPTTEQP